MAGSLVPRDQVEELVRRALDVARFAGRRGQEWTTPDGVAPWPMGVQARATLNDKSAKAATKMRKSVEALRQAVKEVVAIRGAADAEAREPERRAILKKRGRLLRSAEKAVQAAPATAVSLFDESFRRLHDSGIREEKPSNVEGRQFAIDLEGLVRPLLNEIETKLAAEKVVPMLDDLRKRLAAFRNLVTPRLADLAKQSSDGGRQIGPWREASWSEVLIVAVSDVLAAAPKRDQSVLDQFLLAFELKKLPSDLFSESPADGDLAVLPDLFIELARAGASDPREGARPTSTSESVKRMWGPDQTFAAVCDQILADQTSGGLKPQVRAGDYATRADVMNRIGAGGKTKEFVNKARQYLTPQGRLANAGWIHRDGDKIVVTDEGAKAWQCGMAKE